MFSSRAAVQPLFGQLADIYGRRWVAIAIVALFTLGSGIAGGASTGATLIAGRAVQGIGSGGVSIINDVIVSDLVPLRVRGNYMAVILVVYTVGMASAHGLAARSLPRPHGVGCFTSIFR